MPVAAISIPAGGVNSSAPISGVVRWRVSLSKSVVMATGVAEFDATFPARTACKFEVDMKIAACVKDPVGLLNCELASLAGRPACHVATETAVPELLVP